MLKVTVSGSISKGDVAVELPVKLINFLSIDPPPSAHPPTPMPINNGVINDAQPMLTEAEIIKSIALEKDKGRNVNQQQPTSRLESPESEVKTVEAFRDTAKISPPALHAQSSVKAQTGTTIETGPTHSPMDVIDEALFNASVSRRGQPKQQLQKEASSLMNDSTTIDYSHQNSNDNDHGQVDESTMLDDTEQSQSQSQDEIINNESDDDGSGSEISFDEDNELTDPSIMVEENNNQQKSGENDNNLAESRPSSRPSVAESMRASLFKAVVGNQNKHNNDGNDDNEDENDDKSSVDQIVVDNKDDLDVQEPKQTEEIPKVDSPVGNDFHDAPPATLDENEQQEPNQENDLEAHNDEEVEVEATQLDNEPQQNIDEEVDESEYQQIDRNHQQSRASHASHLSAEPAKDVLASLAYLNSPINDFAEDQNTSQDQSPIVNRRPLPESPASPEEKSNNAHYVINQSPSSRNQQQKQNIESSPQSQRQQSNDHRSLSPIGRKIKKEESLSSSPSQLKRSSNDPLSPTFMKQNEEDQQPMQIPLSPTNRLNEDKKQQERDGTPASPTFWSPSSKAAAAMPQLHPIKTNNNGSVENNNHNQNLNDNEPELETPTKVYNATGDYSFDTFKRYAANMKASPLPSPSAESEKSNMSVKNRIAQFEQNNEKGSHSNRSSVNFEPSQLLKDRAVKRQLSALSKRSQENLNNDSNNFNSTSMEIFNRWNE